MHDRGIAFWLLACCALVFAMVVVGGVTRLTHSGLSIVEWQPIVGAMPPLDDAAWQSATPVTEFTQTDPKEGEPATERTEVRFMFDFEGAKRIV